MSVTAATGFLAGAAATGKRKTGADDVCVILSETPAAAAGVFTTNQMAAPCITQAKEALGDGVLGAIVVNAGNANACTGVRGLDDAWAMADRAAQALGLAAGDVAVASTGVIGVPLDMEAFLPAIDRAAAATEPAGGSAAAAAIMTTDTFAKEAVAQVDVDGVTYTVGGMAKGAGMIRPDMATMLAFVTTDAPLTAAACHAALAKATKASFNRITVDGETSTNDCCILLANGAAGGAPIEPHSTGFEPVAQAIALVAAELARAIVRDGEGATKFVEISVVGAATDLDAEAAAMAVANSLLFKCAIFGKDANWGRVVSAVGASRAKVDPETIAVRFAGIQVASAGTAVPFDESAASEALDADEIAVEIDLGLGTSAATVWTCDLSYEYVRVNADYRS